MFTRFAGYIIMREVGRTGKKEKEKDRGKIQEMKRKSS